MRYKLRQVENSRIRPKYTDIGAMPVPTFKLVIVEQNNIISQVAEIFVVLIKFV